jgi:predicted AlkP superfamily pyrophosphatase or phosphodiesterase
MVDICSLVRATALAAFTLLFQTRGLLAAVSPDVSPDPAGHVVLVVWDGMRPDFIRPDLTPHLWNLRTNGVFFKGNRSVYVSSTEVNGTALATGDYPGHSGIIANKMYFPEINLLEPAATENPGTIRRFDALSGGKYLEGPTIAETVQKAGFRTAVAGSKDVCLLHDRSNSRSSDAARQSPVVHAGRALPSSLLRSIKQRNGADFPASAIPNKARDEWTTEALLRTFWQTDVPRFSLLWLSEPDASQHNSSPGSSNALAAVAHSDAELGEVLKALEAKGVRNKTDVFVVSDHGFSTISSGPDVCELLRKAGFAAYRKLEDPERGEILVVGLGGSVLFYVMDHDEPTIRALVKFLQNSEFAGVIFSRLQIPGAFSLEQGRIDCGARRPDVALAMRWEQGTNRFGAPGFLIADAGKKGAGTHGSLSPFDLHNTLVACGPHLRRGFVDEFPSGNIDVAPTILWLLGINPAAPMDGRVLLEAMAGQTPTDAQPATKTLEAACATKDGQWKQYLKLSTIEGRVYFDEGNGTQETR